MYHSAIPSIMLFYISYFNPNYFKIIYAWIHNCKCHWNQNKWRWIALFKGYYMIATLNWHCNYLHVLTRFQTWTNVMKINTSSSLWKLAKQQMLLLKIAGTFESLDEKHFVKKKSYPVYWFMDKPATYYCLI